ncbi:MAG: hypothetical protein Q9191_004777 [Dirinaria sp. TL-2023a]
MPPRRVIIDTDPGVDDVLALLLALSSSPEDLEVQLISITFGNVDVKGCLRNVVSMFHVIEKEIHWRRQNGRPEGFEALRRCKPLVAIGAEKPLGEQMIMADYFRTCKADRRRHRVAETVSRWEGWPGWCSHEYSPLTSAAANASGTEPASSSSLFKASNRSSYHEILRLLGENHPDTIDIIAIGPLTNVALAASQDPRVFLRARSVLFMGGAISLPGNITPVAEFNTIADPMAAARVFALTSRTPESTMPPQPPLSTQEGSNERLLPPYPPKAELGDRRLNLILFPLDITDPHRLLQDEFEAKTGLLMERGSPLAEWTKGFIHPTFKKMESLHHGHEGRNAAISLHDPLCVWYALTATQQKDRWQITRDEDIRIETAGQWTRGMCVVDRRDRKKLDDDVESGDEPSDNGDWLSRSRGNNVGRCIATPGDRVLAPLMLDTIFG